MTTLFSELVEFFEEENWKYEILEGENIVRFHYKGSAGRLLCYGEVDEQKHWVIFYSYLPVNIPSDKLGAAAEFICRANQGMRIGNFELDFEDGEVRYKTSIDIEGGELTAKMIDNLLRANLSTMNRYFPGIMKLIYGNLTPKAAIETVEGKRPSLPNLNLPEQSDDDDEAFGSELDTLDLEGSADDEDGIDSDLEDLSDDEENDPMNDSDDSEEENSPPSSENDCKS